MPIREEREDDVEAIRRVVAAAFEGHPHGDGREPGLVAALRDAGALAVSLVAEEDGEVVGHVAFSPVRIGGASRGWYGLGPLAVLPRRQDAGLGRALVVAGLARLGDLGASGCVVLGEPGYYGRFGFRRDPGLRLEGVPPEYFLALAFGPGTASGAVEYHPAFRECDGEDARRAGGGVGTDRLLTDPRAGE